MATSDEGDVALASASDFSSSFILGLGLRDLGPCHAASRLNGGGRIAGWKSLLQLFRQLLFLLTLRLFVALCLSHFILRESYGAQRLDMNFERRQWFRCMREQLRE